MRDTTPLVTLWESPPMGYLQSDAPSYQTATAGDMELQLDAHNAAGALEVHADGVPESIKQVPWLFRTTTSALCTILHCSTELWLSTQVLCMFYQAGLPLPDARTNIAHNPHSGQQVCPRAAAACEQHQGTLETAKASGLRV